MDELLAQFLVEAPELVQQAGEGLLALEDGSGGRPQLDGAFRAIHTLKGSVALFDMAPLGAALHAAEDWLQAVRAGAEAAGGPRLKATLELVGRLDGWFARLAPEGGLPPDAAPLCLALAAALRAGGAGEAPSQTVAATDTGALPGWAEAFLLRHGREGVRALLRYRPDPDAFYRGEDPLARLAALQGLVELEIAPVAPWPEPALYDPYRCALVFTATSTAEPEQVRAALRLAGGEVEVCAPPLPDPTAGDAPLPDGAGRRLRVDPARVDALLGVADDLVAAVAALHGVEADGATGRAFGAVRARLEGLAAELHGAVMQVRLAPLVRTFERLPRMVRDIAQQLGKPVRLELEGDGLEADRAVVDGLYEPLLHLLRNALDHGIEPAEVRAAAGKPAEATVRVSAQITAERLELIVEDDGRGLDPVRIRQTALLRGLSVPDGDDPAAVLDLLFAPGFSTAEAVSDLSGRGVGLDSVRRSVEALGGRVTLSSDPGRGARAHLSLPLGAVLTRLLLVEVGTELYGVPLARVEEAIRLPLAELQEVGRGSATLWRGRILPVAYLCDGLGLKGQADGTELRALVVRDLAGERVGLAVDRLAGRLEGVVRPLAGVLAGLPGVLGSTLGADGAPLFVLDPAAFVR
jgi:two-component system, chemotaxis family, sensor kinase CheA